MMANRRHWILALLLGATLFATWQAARQPDDAADLARPVPSRVGTAASMAQTTTPAGVPGVVGVARQPGLRLERLTRASEAVGEVNPFAPPSLPPALATPAPQVPVAQAPVAPPLPYALAGKLQDEGGRWVYYLMRGDQSFAVSEGEVFDSQYRLQGVENDRLVIEYTPLAFKQYLPLGSEF